MRFGPTWANVNLIDADRKPKRRKFSISYYEFKFVRAKLLKFILKFLLKFFKIF